MTDKHPITPPATLVAEWASESLSTQDLCTKATRWGADQELEACCDILRGEFNYHHLAEPLRQERRHKPSQKEQALTLLSDYKVPFYKLSAEQAEIIRRALKELPENSQ